MAKEGALGFSRTVLRKKFRTGMTVRAYREKEVVFSQGGDGGRCLLHTERHGEAHGGLHASQESHHRPPAARQLLWRRLPSGAISPHLHGDINWAVQYRSTAKGEHGSYAQARPEVCNAVCWISAFPDCSNRGRPGRSVLQFQRKATGAGSVAVWANKQGIKAGVPPEGEPINPGGDGGYDPRKSE